jgi:beta-glucosidase
MNPTRLDNLFDALVELHGEANLFYAPGYTEKGDAADQALIQEALDLAKKADVVVVCAGLTELYEIEGIDRQDLHLPPGHDALIQSLAEAHPQVVVVLSNGAPVEMPWVQNVPSILEGYLGGQAGAGALARILTGKTNPSGKLAETFPLQLEDSPAQPFPGGPATVEHRESIYVGYRYYDTAAVEVLFPFGHGLSYTSFEYRDLKVALSEDAAEVTFRIKNTGDLQGMEIAQLYIRDSQSTIFRPDKELKGFAKVKLDPGQEAEVALTLDRRAFAYYDIGSNDWVVEAGQFEILVGASSRDIRLSASIDLPGSGKVSSIDTVKPTSYYHPSPQTAFNQNDFEGLIGYPVPPNVLPGRGSYTLNTPISEMRGSLIGRLLYRFINLQLHKMIEGKEETLFGVMTRRMATEISLRVMLLMDDILNRPTAEALLLMINGHVRKGLQNLISSAAR